MDFYIERGLARDMWIPVISCMDSQARKEKKRKGAWTRSSIAGKTPARRASMSFEAKLRRTGGSVVALVLRASVCHASRLT